MNAIRGKRAQQTEKKGIQHNEDHWRFNVFRRKERRKEKKSTGPNTNEDRQSE